LPTATRPAPAGVTSDAGSTDRISSKLDNIEAQLQAQRPAASALAARLAKVEAQTKTLSDSLAAVNQRLDSIAVATQGAREHADAAAASAKGATQNAVQPGALDALASRIAVLERSTKTLETTARRAAPTDDRAARGAVATASLRAAVERGVPFTAELATVKSFGADRGAVATLEPFAASGVPSAGELARELAQLMNPLRQASGTKPADPSFLGRLKNNARNLVRITPVDAPPGNEPAAVIGRLDADAQHADIAAALADIALLPPAARTIVEPWVQKVNARNAAIAASQRIAAGSLAALANTKSR